VSTSSSILMGIEECIEVPLRLFLKVVVYSFIPGYSSEGFSVLF